MPARRLSLRESYVNSLDIVYLGVDMSQRAQSCEFKYGCVYTVCIYIYIYDICSRHRNRYRYSTYTYCIEAKLEDNAMHTAEQCSSWTRSMAWSAAIVTSSVNLV